MAHRLDPLLRPQSIAVLGATERPHSVGRRTVENLLTGGYGGRLYCINPGREQVLGVACYPSLAALPETVDHVVFCIADRRVEQALEQTLEHGARAITLMSQLIVDGDPEFAARIRQRVLASGILLCGPNGMGYYNCMDGVWVCGFDTRHNHPRGGNVTLISHSGAGMSGIIDCEERIDFNLAVSTGSEWTVNMADYMDFAIEVHGTRVIGLFMETARDPAALVAVLEKARARRVPVVAIKVGRTQLAAQLAQSHSGAMAGEDAAYQALFDAYGVQRVCDMDELATTLMLFAQPYPVGPGGLAAIHDSGGERQLLIDLADELGTPLGNISDATRQALSARLDPGLPPVNPLDAWGAGGEDADQIMIDCLSAMLRDPGVAVGAVVHDRAPLSKIYPEYLGYMRAAHAASGKPMFLVANRQGSGSDPLAVTTTREGFPVVDGLRSFLTGVNALFNYRDFLVREQHTAPHLAARTMQSASATLPAGPLNEVEAADFLRAVGLPVNPSRLVNSEVQLLEAAAEMGYPLVLKTANRDISHKTESNGVRLNLGNQAELLAAWQDLCERLGPEVLVAPMVHTEGLEMVLGMHHDDQFGPLVMLGFGGVRLEAMHDVVFALPPFSAATARRLLSGLKQAPLFSFDRGQGRADIDAYCEMAALFSALVASWAENFAEMDLNPVLVHAGGCVALDALIVPKQAAPQDGAASTHHSRKAS